MGKKFLVEVEEVSDGPGCFSVIGFIVVVGIVLMVCAAMANG